MRRLLTALACVLLVWTPAAAQVMKLHPAAAGGAPPPTSFTWDPAQSSTLLGFGNGNRDMLGMTSGSGWASARATLPQSSGKWCADATLVTTGVGNPLIGLGLSNLTPNLQNDFLGDADVSVMATFASPGVFASPAVTVANNSASAALIGAATNGSILTLCFDMGAKQAFIALGGVFAASQNPATGANPWLTWSTTTTFYVSASVNANQGSTDNLRLSATPSFSPPAGYTYLNQ